ncbi:NAD(P)/FAD-dependent oxidoreductase [Chromobacterium haemolyticum]|nr:NAD(P)/FAD-dependent oxidoreductase [Chromobacterium haemolyticum]
MRRREVLRLAAALAGLPLLSGCERVLRLGVPLRLNRPGMAAGHRLRGGMTPPPPRDERRCRVAIVGSGVAGLFAAWRLRKEGFDDVVVLDGPEPDGNAAAGAFGGYRYPTGAHYLPLPSMESRHVRELLAEMGVIESDPFGARPRFDERVTVHAPDERLWVNGHWQEGLLPRLGMGADELAGAAAAFSRPNRRLARTARPRRPPRVLRAGGFVLARPGLDRAGPAELRGLAARQRLHRAGPAVVSGLLLPRRLRQRAGRHLGLGRPALFLQPRRAGGQCRRRGGADLAGRTESADTPSARPHRR